MSLTVICAKIDAGIDINCDKPIQAGTRDVAIVFNYDDFQDATLSRNVTNPQIIEDIDLPSGVIGYVIQGQNGSTLPKNMMVKGKFTNSYDHEVSCIAWELNPDVKDQLEKMCKGRFVVIVENNYRGDNGEAAFEIYGLDSGLIMSALERDPTNQDNQGAYSFTLKSSETSREAHLPATIFITNYSTTKTLVESLV